MVMLGKPDPRCYRVTDYYCDNCEFCEIVNKMTFIFLDDKFCPRWIQNECQQCGRCE